jgi:hypothetical protein
MIDATYSPDDRSRHGTEGMRSRTTTERRRMQKFKEHNRRIAEEVLKARETELEKPRFLQRMKRWIRKS